MEPELVILGAGGHARVVADACLTAGRRLRGFLDMRTPERPLPAPLLGDDTLLSSAALRDCELLIGIGSEAGRARCASSAAVHGHRLACIVHPSATLARDVTIAPGAVVFAGAVVNTGSAIGPLAVVNTAATIDHDCVLAECAQVGPGARLAGNVHIGERAFIGTGAIVLPGRRVGTDAVVGAGAVVTRDVADATTVVGVPAKPIA
jgi:UDP-perosamine 4-acetyltransferase